MPALAPSWVSLEQWVDTAVDKHLGELVELHPWTALGFGQGGGPDPNRAVLAGPTIIGMYVTAGAHASGEISAGAAGASTEQLQQKIWLSIQTAILGSANIWQAYDRVFFPWRNEWYTIVYVDPSATLRNNVHLARMQAVDLQATLNNSIKLARRWMAKRQRL